MRHPYLDRAFSMLLLCAALGCGSDDKSDSGGTGSETGSETGEKPPKPVTPTDFSKIDKSKKVSALTPSEVKGLCVATRDDLVTTYLGECRVGAVAGVVGEECSEALKGCDDSVLALDEATLAQICDTIPPYPEDCAFTVAQYVACQKELVTFYEGLECTEDGATPTPPDCFDTYAACRYF